MEAIENSAFLLKQYTGKRKGWLTEHSTRGIITSEPGFAHPRAARKTVKLELIMCTLCEEIIHTHCQ